MSPLNPVFIATVPAAMFPIIIGMKNTETLSGFTLNFVTSLSVRLSPPTPTPIITPTLKGSRSLRSVPAFFIASRDAQSANWVKRSILLLSFLSMYSPGSKSFTAPTIFTGKSDASNWSIKLRPFFPAFMFSQNSSTLLPRGFTVPMPVITTLLILKIPPKTYADGPAPP